MQPAGWDIHRFDMKTAFLRGTENSNRILGPEPPEDMRSKMKFKSGEIVEQWNHDPKGSFTSAVGKCTDQMHGFLRFEGVYGKRQLQSAR